MHFKIPTVSTPKLTYSRFLGQPVFWLWLLIVVVLILNFAWVQLDTRPQPLIDPYPTKILNFVDGMREHGIAWFPGGVSDIAPGPRPPLYQLSAAPFVAFVERSADAMLISNGLFLIVLTLATYRIGDLTMRSKWGGLLAALIVLSYPPIINLSRIVRPHAIVPAAAALVTMYYLMCMRGRKVSTAWLMGAALALAGLLHPNTFYLIALPAVVGITHLIFFQTEPILPASPSNLLRWSLVKLKDPFVIMGLIPAATSALALTAIWYILKSDQVGLLFGEYRANWDGVRFGFNNIPASVLWYAQSAPGALSHFFALLFVIGCVVGFLPRSRASKPTLTVLLVAFTLMYCAMSLRVGVFGWPNFAPVLPLTAVITAAGVLAIFDQIWGAGGASASVVQKTPIGQGTVQAFRKTLAVVLLVVCIAMATLNYSIAGWGVPHNQSMWKLLGVPLEEACDWRMNVAFCPNPPHGGDWQMRNLLQRILENPKCRREKCKLVVITHKASVFDYFSHSAIKFRLRQYYPGYTLALTLVNPENADWLGGDYFVYVEDVETKTLREAIIEFLEVLPKRFRGTFVHLARFDLPNGRAVRLVERTASLTEDDAHALISALGIPHDLEKELLEHASENSR